MSELVAVIFPERHRASEVLASLARHQTGYLIDVGDAVVVERDADGAWRLHAARALGPAGAVETGGWPLLLRWVFFPDAPQAPPMPEAALPPAFLNQLRDGLTPESSALLVWRRQFTPEAVDKELARYYAPVLRARLSPEAEALISPPVRPEAEGGDEGPGPA